LSSLIGNGNCGITNLPCFIIDIYGKIGNIMTHDRQ